MTLYEFNQLSPAEKMRVVVASATYLARRWHGGGGFSLYHLPGQGRGFYVEVRYDPGLNSLEVVRSSARTELLDAYQLPVRWQGAGGA